MWKCKKCNEWLTYLGVLLGATQIWGCPKCRRTWWKLPKESEINTAAGG